MAATGVEIKKHVLWHCQGRALLGTSCTSEKDIVQAYFPDPADPSYAGAEGVRAFLPGAFVFCKSHAEARCESLKAATGVEVVLRSSRRRCVAFNDDGTQCVHRADYRDLDPETDATKCDFCASHASAKRAGLDAKHGAGYARPKPATTAPTSQFVTPHGMRCEKTRTCPTSLSQGTLPAHTCCATSTAPLASTTSTSSTSQPPSHTEQRAVTKASASRSCSRSSVRLPWRARREAALKARHAAITAAAAR